MLGILFFLLTVLTGLCLIVLFIPDLFSFTDKTYNGQRLSAPSFTIVFPASVLIGTIVIGWLTYILAYAFSKSGDGLKIAEPICFSIMALFIITTVITNKNKLKSHFDKLFSGISGIDIALILLLVLFAVFVDTYTFGHRDNAFYASKDVIGDFAVHLGLIRSFSQGNNFPTEYPLFAGIDIRYHFMFQFYTAVLEHLGLRLDIAFNLVSITFFTSAFVLLYTLALKLFGRRSVGVLSVIFALFRSSTSFFIYVIDLIRNGQPVFKTILSNTAYVGYTFHESWGLYNINSYTSQRHLAFGICSLLFVILVYLSDFKPTSAISSKETWMPARIKQPVFLGIILGLTGFYHGSCVISCLLILFILALFSDHKLEYAITAFITCLLVILQANFFAKESVVSMRFEPGYLAYDINVVVFLFILLGAFLVLLIVSLFFFKDKLRYILIAFMAPSVFAFLFKLSVETETNHKFIIVSCMLCDIFIAALLTDPKFLNLKKPHSKVLFTILVFLMICTGICDLITFYNYNRGKLYINDHDPVTEWIMENSDSTDIFLTCEYSLTRETIAGTMMYYGYSYPSWGAGYDVDGRNSQVISMYEADNSNTLDELCTGNNIRFIIVDERVRNSQNYNVREDIIAQTYECVFSYEDENGVENIYDTSKPVARIS